MNLFIDDRPAPAAAEYLTIEDAVKAVQTDCGLTGRLVVHLRCDGSDVSGDAIPDALQRRAATVSRLDLYTATKRELVIDAMTEASASLQATEQECRRVAELLTQGRTQEGIEAFGDCLKIWQQINAAVTKSMQMLGLDADRATIRDVPLADVLAKPKEVLLQVREALTVQDYVLLSDVLQYELSDVTEQWYAVLALLRREADELDPAAPDA